MDNDNVIATITAYYPSLFRIPVNVCVLPE